MDKLPIKPRASMLVAVVAAEVTLFIMSYIPVFHVGVRNWGPALVCDAFLVFMLKYIIEHHYLARRWESAVKLSGYISAFYTCLVAPGILEGYMSIFSVFFLALDTFIVIVVMLLAMVYVKY